MLAGGCGALQARPPRPVADLLDSLRAALADRYAVERELGRGGMATVFLAEDRKHHRSVAIKVLHAELTAALGAERFLREIEIAARLQHPHILPLYDSGAAAGFLYARWVGEPPFTGPTAQAVLARHSLDMVSPPSIVRSTIPDAVEGAVLRALAKVPADRYPTTALFAEALNMPSAATGAHRRATLDRAVRRPRSALWRIALWRIAPVAAVVVALAAYLAIRSARAGRGAAAGGLDPRHVAVLYFEDESNGKTLGYLADGLTEALIAELSRIQPLVVTSRNGVAQFRQDSIAPDSIARALDAGTLVQGAVNEQCCPAQSSPGETGRQHCSGPRCGHSRARSGERRGRPCAGVSATHRRRERCGLQEGQLRAARGRSLARKRQLGGPGGRLPAPAPW